LPRCLAIPSNNSVRDQPIAASTANLIDQLKSLPEPPLDLEAAVTAIGRRSPRRVAIERELRKKMQDETRPCGARPAATEGPRRRVRSDRKRAAGWRKLILSQAGRESGVEGPHRLICCFDAGHLERAISARLFRGPQRAVCSQAFSWSHR
jgi:hypothetical protein